MNFFILITCLLDNVLILMGEILCWSHLPFISSIRILLFTFLKLLSGMEGEPTSDWGVKGNISLCDCSCCWDWLFSSAGRACTISSSRGASLLCPGTNECDRDTPRFTTGALIAAANSSSALKGNRKCEIEREFSLIWLNSKHHEPSGSYC